MTPTNTGHATCDACGASYDYAPDSPLHVCETGAQMVECLRTIVAVGEKIEASAREISALLKTPQ
jgi:hypothetical protein